LPAERLAECLSELGENEEAACSLQEAIGNGGHEDARLWNRWLALSFVELQRTPEMLLSGLPDSESAYAADVRWLLERLQSQEALRIDCGRKARPESEVADRFCWGGSFPRSPLHVPVDVPPEDARIYEYVHTFDERDLDPAYRIPLPPRRYRVVLHLMTHRPLDLRRQRIQLEGQETKPQRVPVKCPVGAVEKLLYDVDVHDGILDIELDCDEVETMIAAIEVTPR
jgi:hypothetical protein